MNAKAECIRCESLNTYYHKNNHICNNCGHTERIPKTNKALKMLLGASIIILNLMIWL